MAQCASPLQVGRATASDGPGCPVFVACEPADSCLGANKCAANYQGERCQDCAARFYRVNGECIKCPDSPMAVIIVFVLLALLALASSWALTKYNVTISLIAIGIDYAQVVSIFSRTKIRWPAVVKQIFQILSAFNVNLELAAPECLLETVTFYNKWLAIEMLPLVAIVFLGLIYVDDEDGDRSYNFQMAILDVDLDHHLDDEYVDVHDVHDVHDVE